MISVSVWLYAVRAGSLEELAAAAGDLHWLAITACEPLTACHLSCAALSPAGEQTWPTEEELAAAAAAGGAKLRKRRLPAGTSEYQAAWILDDDEGSGGSGEAEESGER
jgi:hypothetical protein